MSDNKANKTQEYGYLSSLFNAVIDHLGLLLTGLF